MPQVLNEGRGVEQETEEKRGKWDQGHHPKSIEKIGDCRGEGGEKVMGRGIWEEKKKRSIPLWTVLANCGVGGKKEVGKKSKN